MRIIILRLIKGDINMNNKQRKNLAILVALVVVMAVIYILSIIKIQENIACSARAPVAQSYDGK